MKKSCTVSSIRCACSRTRFCSVYRRRVCSVQPVFVSEEARLRDTAVQHVCSVVYNICLQLHKDTLYVNTTVFYYTVIYCVCTAASC